MMGVAVAAEAGMAEITEVAGVEIRLHIQEINQFQA
jgi:hypothetical protein